MKEVLTLAGYLMFQISITSPAYFGLIRALAFYESLFLPLCTYPLVPMVFCLLFSFHLHIVWLLLCCLDQNFLWL